MNSVLSFSTSENLCASFRGGHFIFFPRGALKALKFGDSSGESAIKNKR